MRPALADTLGAWFLESKKDGVRLRPAEEFPDRALACGLRIILAGGLRGDVLLAGNEAEEAFRKTRQPL